jgi:hypothetical protein
VHRREMRLSHALAIANALAVAPGGGLWDNGRMT